MPQLPSGRHVAIDPYPLLELLDDSDNAANIHKILPIDSISKMMDWLLVAYFITPEDAHGKGIDPKMGEGSLTPPPGLVYMRTGFTLSRWDELAVDWSKEDRTAMMAFLSEPRYLDYMEHRLMNVKQRQQRILSSDSVTTKLLAGMWMAGIHPAQDENHQTIWGEETLLEWDTYDMLAALKRIVAYMVTHPEIYQEHGNVFDRASGMWQMFSGHHPFLRQLFTPDISVRDVAKEWREVGHLGLLSAEKQAWFHNQMVIECTNLCNLAGETLEKNCPHAFAILTLVSLSPAGVKST
ncbi:hypothetical protein [Sulfurirhabdus autotrophica]|uniref:Uncharacterized protein n=1 Tax=Sulfurirhabdus autotrophica TaxID=1706046 RepID=A0A4R3XSF0_9PROT|nr:hypothetical protein [Sulfurirhabdus autotrophica]TCV81272.1 hypothetical protein EDC63_12421 [Sulfurirhabdus autotrophica]